MDSGSELSFYLSFLFRTCGSVVYMVVACGRRDYLSHGVQKAKRNMEGGVLQKPASNGLKSLLFLIALQTDNQATKLST